MNFISIPPSDLIDLRSSGSCIAPEAKVKFGTQGAGQTPNILTLLPEGETVENITMLKVLDTEGNLLLTAMFD